ncbi:MAG: hypothetical protein WCK15_07370, partial [Pirellula sp.]
MRAFSTFLWVIIGFVPLVGCSDSAPVVKQTQGHAETEIGQSGNTDSSFVRPSQVAMPQQERQPFSAIKAEYEAADKQFRKEFNDKALAFQREAEAAQKAAEAQRHLELATKNQPSESQPIQPTSAPMRSVPAMAMFGPG